MAEHVCEINANDLYSALNNPATQANFLNPDYGDPAGPPGGEGSEFDVPSCWSILIYYQDQPYEFCWFQGGDTPLQIVKTFGQKGTATFELHDYLVSDLLGDKLTRVPAKSIMPFIPVEEQRMQILVEGRVWFDGYIRDIIQTPLAIRADNTEASRYVVSCVDLYAELEFKQVLKTYENKTLGFILRDVIWRYTNLDPSEIDPALGFTVSSYPINEKTPAQVLTHITELTETTYWIEPGTRKIRLLPKDDGGAAYPITITDDNVYNWFERDTFSIRRDGDMVKNRIKFWFSERYTAGTVNVATGSNIVAAFGVTPLTEWDDLPAGLQFKLANSEAIYNVEKNNSAGAVQELRLSSPFAEGDATDQAYELRGNRRPIVLADWQSIGQRATIRGGDGIVDYTVSEDQNFFTPTEARRFAQALLALSRPLAKGQATTFTDAWTFEPLEAGMIMPFDLPLSKRFIGNVVVQSVTITELGGYANPTGTKPYCQIDFGFTATLSQTQTQMRKMMQDLRKVKVSESDVELIDVVQLPETLAMKDCIHSTVPVPLNEFLTLMDDIGSRIVSERALYYSELDHALSATDYAFSSD